MAQRHRGHPLALKLWAILRDRSDTDRRLVFDALERRLGIGETTAKQDLALRALRHWMEVHESESAPSKNAWERFRSSHADPGLLPSATLIRNAFGGSWTRAAAIAEGRPQADVGSRRLTASGRRMKRAEVIEAIRDWASTVDADQPLLQAQFLSWCREQLFDPASKYELLPTTEGPFIKLVGYWQDVLTEIGEARRSSSAWARKLRAGEAAVTPAAGTGAAASGAPVADASGGGTGSAAGDGSGSDVVVSSDGDGDADGNESAVDAGTRGGGLTVGSDVLATAPTSPPGAYSQSELKEWMRWLAGLTDDRGASLGAKAFNRLRGQVITAALNQGQVMRIPSAVTLTQRLGFGSWDDAKRAAGLTVARREPGAGLNRRYSDAELKETVRLAATEVTGANAARLTDLAYRSWRLKRIEQLRHRDPEARMPSHVLLRRRLGPKWEDVLRAAGVRSGERTNPITGSR